jgi:hypothetical protein
MWLAGARWYAHTLRHLLLSSHLHRAVAHVSSTQKNAPGLNTWLVSFIYSVQRAFSIKSLLPPPARTRISQILSKCNLPKYQPSSFRQSKMYKTLYKRQNVKLISKRPQTSNQWATNINRAPELHYCWYQVPNKGTCQNSTQNWVYSEQIDKL